MHPLKSLSLSNKRALKNLISRNLSNSSSSKNASTSSHPNILIIMADQLNGTFFPEGGPAEWLHAPHLKALAERSVRFSNAYTASPLCAPGRASFMSGQLPKRTRVYDNAAEFASDIPTYAHHLRRAGYYVALSGKMHFVGPDQLHGFEERLTTDIYPADFGWTPDYRKPDERIDWWYHNLCSVTNAGTGEITNQLEYDEEVAFLATQKLYQLCRKTTERRPWCLTVSFTHPHDPYVTRPQFWDLYKDCKHLRPSVESIPFAQQDPHSERLLNACDYQNFNITQDDIMRSRRAYFGNISFIDERVGELMDVLERTRMLDDTIIVFCSDHGDMLGERGLWFKMSFFEGSARVPLMISKAGSKSASDGHLVDTPVSTIDVVSTLAEMVGLKSLDEVQQWTDGESLVPFMDKNSQDEPHRGPVLMEYAAEGTHTPMVCIRRGRFKYVHCTIDPPQLFDLDEDPHETKNLAYDPAHQMLASSMHDEVNSRWNLPAYDAAVRESQARRRVVYEALRNGQKRRDHSKGYDLVV
ncbi:sulfatase domain-containing protein [Ditylenchus destructor]|nr:sulfatase domain-containing protein [Ditylenchus destructor]